MDTTVVLVSTPELVARKGENMGRPSIPAKPVAGEVVKMIDLDHEFSREDVDTWALVQLAQAWGL